MPPEWTYLRQTPTRTLNIATLESEGLIPSGALDSLGVTSISVGDLLDSDLVDVEIGDLVDAGLNVLEETTEASDAEFVDFDTLLSNRAYSLGDALSMGLISQEEFDLTKELALSAVEAAGLIDPGELGTGNITLQALLDSTAVSVSLADLIDANLVARSDLLDLAQVAAGSLGIEGFDLGELVDLGLLEQSDIVDFHYDLFNLQDQPIDLGFDVGDVLELGTTATADILVTVEGGFEWVIDFDGPTGTEGFTFLINNAQVSGRASLDVEDLEFYAKLGFMSLEAGGEGTDSGVHLLAEATITLDEDGDIETEDDRQFSFTDLVSGGLIDNFLFDFNGFGEARLKSLDVSPNIPGLDETGLNNMELSITIPDLLNWDTVEVVEGDTTVPAIQQEIESHLAQDHVVIVVPDFSNAFNFQDMDFGAIIDAIRTGVEFIEAALQDTSFYNQNIPIINRSIEDSFTFVEDMLDKIELAADDPAAALQEVEDIIEDALGLTDEDAFQLSIDPDDSEVIKVHIEWDKMLSDLLDEEYMNLSFAFNLGDMIGIFGGTVGTGWDFLDELVSAGADISWDAFVSMTAEVGIDYSDIASSGDVDFFLYDYDAHGAGTEDDTGTRVTVGVKVEGTDLELMFNPFGIGVNGGSAYLGTLTYDNDDNPATGTESYYAGAGYVVTDVDFATFTLGIDQDVEGGEHPTDDGRFYMFSEILSNNFTYDLVGGFDVYLPLEIPLLSVTPLHVYTNNAPDPTGWGDGALLEAFKRLAGSGSSGPEAIIVDIPSITMPDFGLLSILNDPSYILDGLDWGLGTVQDVIGSGFAQDIPLIGDKLGQAATFIRDIRTGFLADLREKLNGPGTAIAFIQESMYDVFGPGQLNILQDRDGNGIIELADVGVGWYDASGNLVQEWTLGDAVPETADAIQFDVPLGGTAFATGIDIPLDIDVPGFGLQVDGGFAVEMSWNFDFSFGLSVEDGFYLNTNDKSSPGTPELTVEIGAFLDGEPLNNAEVTPFYAEGKLLFFILSVDDIDRDPDQEGFQPSGVFGDLSIDVIGDSQTGRVTLNRLISSPVEDIFDIDMGLDATLNLTMTLDIGDIGLPQLKTDFVASWGWTLDGGSEDPEFGLYNLRIEVGTFITDVIKPITDKISDVLSPFEPVLDVLLTEVDGLETMVNPPNLLGLINTISSALGYSEIPVEFFNAAKSMIEIVNQVDAMIGTEGEILLGDIMGLGTDNVTARQESGSLPSSVQSVLNGITEASTGASGEFTSGTSGGGSSTDRGGFEIVDHILDISNWMKLITGGDAIIFTYEMPLLEYELNFNQTIATLTAGPVVLNLAAVGNLTAQADLGFGYDTYGIRRAIETGNWWYAFDGFYIADFGITSGQEKDEFSFGIEIGLEASIWALLVEAGLGGVVGFEMGLDINDINDDGRVHFSELDTMWNYTGNDAPGGLLNIINLDARAYFEAYVFVDVGVSIPFVGKIMKRVVDWTIFDITLAEWEYDAPKVQPVLAHTEGDTLVLHTGSRAGDREYLDTDDGGEKVTLTGDENSITVTYGDWSYSYTPDSGTFSKIIADGGSGDDVFDASGVSGVDVEFDGGAGDDKLTAGSGTGIGTQILVGGPGNDTLSASGSTSAARLEGNDGDDRITGGSGTNEILGGDGDDRITAGDGVDSITGGAGADSLTGMDGTDTYYFTTGFGEDRFSDTKGSTVVDLSGVSDDLTVNITANGVTINTANEELCLGRAQLTHLILGSGNDTIYISDPAEGLLTIEDTGGASTTTFQLGRNTSTKADGIIYFVDSDSDFDEVIFENLVGMEMDSALPDTITINDHEIRNAREVFQFTDDVEQFTLVAQESEIDEQSVTTFHPINLTITSDIAQPNMGQSDLYISGQNIVIKPKVDGTSMLFNGDNIVIEAVEDVVLDAAFHTTGNFDITADSIGAQYGSSSPLVHDTEDTLGTIDHAIDAHDLNWHIRKSSLELNAHFNAINDGSLDVYAANAAANAYIDIHEDITSASGDNDDELGGGTMRFVAEGNITMYGGMQFLGASSHLILAADNIYNTTYAGSNKIETTVGGLTVLTRDEGVESGSEIVVQETDSLVIYGLTGLPGAPDSNPVGVSSAHGIIDITLAAVDARLTLDSGSIITRDPGEDITLTADDFDFLSAPEERDPDPERARGGVIGTGQLTILTSHATDFLLGTAAEHPLGNDWTYIRSAYPAFLDYPDYVGGNFSGPEGEETYDDDGSLFTNTVHLSTRDLSALAEGFTLITIGDSTTAQMIFGDAMDADIIKKDGSPRDRDSSFRDDVVFNATKIYIEGEVEAQAHAGDPLVTVQMNTERLHVKSKNINAPLGGLDSGITGDLLDLNGITQRMIVDGWVITNAGDIMIDIQGQGETYVSPMMEEALESRRYNNFVQGIQGILQTNKPGGVIQIETANSVVMAGRTYVSGEGARITIEPGTFFELVQIAGAIYAPGENSLIEINAPAAAYINGEILAGIEWQGGVPVKVADGADVIITTPHELRIFGAVRSTDVMQLEGEDDWNYNNRDEVDASIHLTGQLMSLADNSLLRLEGPDDIIIEGSIFAWGDNSGLYIDSGQRVKFATSFVEVQDDITVFGRGQTEDLTTGEESSVFVDATAVITSFENGSNVNIWGAYDVDILGSIVAGGSIGPTGVTWSGTDSEATIVAGQQVYLNSGILASDSVTIIGGAAGDDDVSAATSAEGAYSYTAATTPQNGAIAEGVVQNVTLQLADADGVSLGSVTINVDNDTTVADLVKLLNTELTNQGIDISVVEDISADRPTGVLRFTRPTAFQILNTSVNPQLVGLTTVTLSTVTAAQEQPRLSVVIDTAGGLTAAGRTSDGSHGLVSIFGESGVEMMGHLYSGANKSFLFDSQGNLIKETVEYETSVGGDVEITSAGQVFIGGWTKNQNNQLQLADDVNLYFDHDDNPGTAALLVTLPSAVTSNNTLLSELITQIQDVLDPVLSGDINVKADDDRVVFYSDEPFTLTGDSWNVDLLGLAGGENIASEVIADAEYTAPTAYTTSGVAQEVTLVVKKGDGSDWGEVTFTVPASTSLEDLVVLLNTELDNSILNDFHVQSEGGKLLFTNAFDFKLDASSSNVAVLGMTDVASTTVSSTREASTYEIRGIQSLFGDVLVTGGYIAAKDDILLTNINTTAHPYTGSDIGVRIQGSSEITTYQDYSSINVDSKYDAEIEGHLIAGGEVENIRDAETGGYIGSVYNDFGTDAAHTEINIEAEHQVRIGTMIKAGGKIQLTGGDDPFEGDPDDIFNFTDTSVLVYGSAHIETWGENSQIILDGPDAIKILTPTHFEEIESDQWVKGDVASVVSEQEFQLAGVLPVPVSLDMWIRDGGIIYTDTLTIPASNYDNDAILIAAADGIFGGTAHFEDLELGYVGRYVTIRNDDGKDFVILATSENLDYLGLAPVVQSEVYYPDAQLIASAALPTTGQLIADVTLDLFMENEATGDTYTDSVTITAASTAGNSTRADLAATIEATLNATDFAPIDVALSGDKLIFTSLGYDFEIRDTSENLNLLGFREDWETVEYRELSELLTSGTVPNTGELARDVVLIIRIDETDAGNVDEEVDDVLYGAVTIPASATNGNTTVAELVADVNAALASTQIPRYEGELEFGDYITAEERDGTLVLVGTHPFKVKSATQNGELLGITASEDLTASYVFFDASYTADADLPSAVLTSPVSLDVEITRPGEISTVSVAIPVDGTNATLEDLVGDVNVALRLAGLEDITATLGGNRLVLESLYDFAVLDTSTNANLLGITIFDGEGKAASDRPESQYELVAENAFPTVGVLAEDVTLEVIATDSDDNTTTVEITIARADTLDNTSVADLAQGRGRCHRGPRDHRGYRVGGNPGYGRRLPTALCQRNGRYRNHGEFRGGRPTRPDRRGRWHERAIES